LRLGLRNGLTMIVAAAARARILAYNQSCSNAEAERFFVHHRSTSRSLGPPAGQANGY